MLKTIAWICVLSLTLSVLPGSAQAWGRDVMSAIEKWNTDISQADKELKFKKMAISPFIFYRATNHLFWRDFADDERLAQFSSSKTATWLQGDLHVENMGVFDSDEEDVIFDVNDFDESLIADYQYDLWRLAISVVLVAREHGCDDDKTAQFINILTESYLDTLGSYCDNDDDEDFINSEENTRGPIREFLREVTKKNSRKEMVEKRTKDGRFDLSLEKLEAVDDEFKKTVEKKWSKYGKSLSGALDYNKDEKYFEIKDVAKRLLAGTGSYGTPRYYILIEGKSKSSDDDRIIDMKRQSQPTALSFISEGVKVEFDNAAHRHSVGYDALTKDTDDHVGILELSDGWYSLRERSPYKGTFPSAALANDKVFAEMCKEWGKVVATAHARSDKDFKGAVVDYQFEEEVCMVTNGRVDEFQALVRQIALEYGSQVESDWQTFLEATGQN